MNGSWFTRSVLFVVGVLSVALLMRQGWVAGNGQPAGGAGRGASGGLGVVSSDEAGRIFAEGRVEVVPGAQVVLASEVRGLLTNVLVAEQTRVKAGDLLAEIGADDVHASWLEARAQVGEIEAERVLARIEVERGRRLRRSETLTAQELDRLERGLELLEARLVTAQVRVKRLEITLGKTRITAPFGGVILARHQQPGEVVIEGHPLLTLVDPDRVRIAAEVDEFDAGRIVQGAAVTIRAEGYGGEWLGKVDEIPESVEPRRLHPQDPASPSDVRVLRVKVGLENRRGLKLGQRVEVEIVPGR